MDRLPKCSPGASVRSFILPLMAAVWAAPLSGQTGDELFRTRCASCHTTGTDRLIGPGLAGVHDRRDRSWLVSFITAPDRMIASGDPTATRLVAEYKLAMPNLGTTEDQAKSILDYLARSASAPAAALTPTVAEPPTRAQILLGQALFQGSTRFENSGPSCNSCHEVTNDAVIGGGILAAELTTVFSRLGGQGVRAILGSPPFPVMQRAYADRPLTDKEVAGLVAFLQKADAEHTLHQPRGYGIRLAGVGVLGAVLLIGVYSTLWHGRRRGSVYQKIFDRQVKSS